MVARPFDPSAGESMLGYLYQVRVGLLRLLQATREDPAVAVAIESLDDLQLDRQGGPDELLQTKHHVGTRADLSDVSPDIWKSLRVWMTRWQDGAIDPRDTSLVLITVAAAPPGAAAAHLRIANRNVDAAARLLRAAARSSENKQTDNARKQFLALSEEQQLLLLDAVVVSDRADDIQALEKQLQQQVKWVAGRHESSLVRSLEGWWFKRVVANLRDPGSGPITGDELEAELDDLRNQYLRDNLPIYADIEDADAPSTLQADQRTFVRQLQLIGIGSNRVLLAIRDYYRAYEQRSRWIREELLLVSELERYERRLIDEWKLLYERMRDDLSAEEAETRLSEAGRELYNRVEDLVHVHIRPRCTAAFISRGTFHILADRPSVGWHRDFLERLAVSLGVEKTGA